MSLFLSTPFSLLPPLSCLSPGPKLTSLEVVGSLERRTEPPLSGAICDLLWADPLLEEVLGYRLSDKDYAEVSLSLTLLHFHFCSLHLHNVHQSTTHQMWGRRNKFLRTIKGLISHSPLSISSSPFSLVLSHSLSLHSFWSWISSRTLPEGAPISTATQPSNRSSSLINCWASSEHTSARRRWVE